MRLSIVIINYNSARLVIDCLASLEPEKHHSDFEILVVDNASSPGQKEMILDEFPKVKWIQMDYNTGFARGNNEGIRQAGGEVILLLNGDTIIVDNAVQKCLAAFVPSPFVACGVQLLNADGSPQISGNFAMTGGLNYLLPLPLMGDLLKAVAALFQMKKANLAEAKSVEKVDWINGAFLMVRRTAIRTAGLMDEDFFLYAEEAEWCSRLRKIGPLCIYGDLHVVHLQGETANETFGSEGKGYYNLFDKKGGQIMLSNMVRIRKEFGVGWFLFMLIAYVLEVPVFLIATMFSKRYSFKNFQGYVSNLVILLKLTPTIMRNQPYFYKVL